MTLLTSEEAGEVSEAFLKTLYGDDIYNEWKALKLELNFAKEKDFVRWLIDVANVYRQDDGGIMSSKVNVGIVKYEDESAEEDALLGMECAEATATESCYDTPSHTQPADDSGGAVRGSEWEQMLTNTAGHEAGVSEGGGEGGTTWYKIMPTSVTQAVEESNSHMFDTGGSSPVLNHDMSVSVGGGARYTCSECQTFTTNKLCHLKQHVSTVHQHEWARQPPLDDKDLKKVMLLKSGKYIWPLHVRRTYRQFRKKSAPEVLALLKQCAPAFGSVDGNKVFTKRNPERITQQQYAEFGIAKENYATSYNETTPWAVRKKLRSFGKYRV